MKITGVAVANEFSTGVAVAVSEKSFRFNTNVDLAQWNVMWHHWVV